MNFMHHGNPSTTDRLQSPLVCSSGLSRHPLIGLTSLLTVAVVGIGLVAAEPGRAASLDEGVELYRAYLIADVDRTLTSAKRLRDSAAAGDLAAAKQAWIEARIGWERSEVFTAGFVPELDGDIDAWPNGLVGFHAIEARLFGANQADFAVRSDAAAAYFVRPAQRVFMDAKQSSELTQLLVPVDPDDPCRQWQAMAQIAGVTDQGAAWRCERIGDEAIAGRRTIKYRGISPREDRYLIWIDPRIDFVVRLEADDGSTVEVADIQEGPQPAQLFEMPAGYVKFDPQKLIDRIKQSDVWVEPPQ